MSSITFVFFLYVMKIISSRIIDKQTIIIIILGFALMLFLEYLKLINLLRGTLVVLVISKLLKCITAIINIYLQFKLNLVT